MSKKTITMIANDLTKVYQSSKQLYVTLLDNDVPLSNKEVYFTINGVTYTRMTNNQGIAQLNINLGIGSYSCTVTSFSDENYNATTKKITVTVTDKKDIVLLAVDFTKTYGTTDPLRITLYYKTSPLVNRDVYITINGITYTRKTDDRGEARLNINLIPGEYQTKVVTFSDEEFKQSIKNLKVTVKGNTRMEGVNVTKTASQTSVYQCAVYDYNNNRVNCDVSLTINGVTYIRHTGNDGLAKLNIRLREGDYTLKAEYKGDNTHNPSSISNNVTVVPDITPLTKRANGNYTIPGNNRGFIESHIYITQISADKKTRYDYPNWGEIIGSGNAIDIRFDNYEIIETDPRVKTAKFTTDKYIDLTKGKAWIYIANPYHENFGGRILDIDYDKTNGLYSYQCQDGRRQYLSKHKTTTSSGIIYDILEHLIINPLVKDALKFPITDEQRRKYARVLSGLHPIDDYNIQLSPAISKVNKMKDRVTTLSYDSLIDKIMNYSHYGQTPVDVYFTPDGILHIDPVDFDTWLSHGIRLTHSDLIHYKYGFDTTNIITSVSVKDPNNHKIYDDWSDLVFYFGMNQSMIDPVTTSNSNISTNNSSSPTVSYGGGNSSSNKNKTVVVGCDSNDSNDSKVQNTVISALQSAGYSTEKLAIAPNPFAAYSYSSKARGKIGVYIIAAGTYSIADYYYGAASGGGSFDRGIFAIRGDISSQLGGREPGFSTRPIGADSDCPSWLCSKIRGLTFPQMNEKLKDRVTIVGGDSATAIANNVVSAVQGNFPGAGISSSSSTTNTTANTGNATTVIDETATYNKALEDMSKSIRNLLSFQIRVPLNDPLFKNLHTNQMLWTELPSDFKLTNLEKIFKILPTYKVNRGVPYQQNRWYVEGLKITCNKNGLFADITLNPFPSSYSVYHNAVKSYAEAYDQAFKSSSNTTTSNNTTVSTVNNIPARTDGKTDCSSTYSLCCAHTGSSANPSNKGYEDRANAQGKIGKDGTNYAEYVKGCTPKEAYKKLAKKHNYGNYRGYSDNAHACASNTLNASTSNCGDRARLLKACMDVLGQPCVIYHVYNHYMNGVLINGKWETVDLCYQSGNMPQYQTAGWNR